MMHLNRPGQARPGQEERERERIWKGERKGMKREWKEERLETREWAHSIPLSSKEVKKEGRKEGRNQRLKNWELKALIVLFTS